MFLKKCANYYNHCFNRVGSNDFSGRELTPLKYNSKLMNSIWGLYNRYSVHNFKKNTDADDLAVAAACWGPANIRNRPPTSSTVEYTAAARFQQYLTTGSAKL